MTSAALSRPVGDHAAEPIPRVVTEYITGLALVAGAANVIMQLSRLPVGRGVVESKVESGRIDRHPVKRTRTTLTYLVVAMLGTPEELAYMRQEVNRSHRQVRSDEASPVKYNAFDRELQLWVAACIYKGFEDTYRMFYGEPGPGTLREFYRHSSRFATTLQVTPDMWPEDREAFEDYWKAGVAQISTDRKTTAYLRSLAGLEFLPGPLAKTVGRFHRIMTVGFLPPEFRELFGFSWRRPERFVFAAVMKGLVLTNRSLPRVLREFPMNAYLWDFRRRMRKGRPFV